MIKWFAKKLLNLTSSFRTYKTEWVEDLPAEPIQDTIYIIGGRKYPFYAAITCPRKDCKQVVHLEISKQFKKRWKFKEHKDGTLSLSPSIYATKLPCRCHYWIKEGRIIWADIPPLFIPKGNKAP